MFNTALPADYRGRSLSVSDVVEIVEAENVKPGFYFCDSIGFKEVPFEPDIAKEQEAKKTMTVVLLEPGKLARKAEIDGSLEECSALWAETSKSLVPLKKRWPSSVM
jgi:hypothetical protein